MTSDDLRPRSRPEALPRSSSSSSSSSPRSLPNSRKLIAVASVTSGRVSFSSTFFEAPKAGAVNSDRLSRPVSATTTFLTVPPGLAD
jgi:hypothetical protein